MIRTVAAVQARLGSTRLPRKVLADLAGRPMIWRLVDRLRAADTIDEVVVATTTDPSDHDLVAACEAEGVRCHRGAVDDLVERLHGTAVAFDADVLVRVWGDCPFVDPAVVDRTMTALTAGGCDYATNSTLAGRTYPVGLDIEIWRTHTLGLLLEESADPFYREFPMEFVRAREGQLKVARVRHTTDLSELHLTVDYPADLALATRIFEALGPDTLFGFEAAVEWVTANRDAVTETQTLGRNADYLAKVAAHSSEALP